MPQFNEKPKQEEESTLFSGPYPQDVLNSSSNSGFVKEETWEQVNSPDNLTESELPVERDITDEEFIMPIEESEEKETKDPFPELEVVGQIHGTYIVAQSEDGFYLIDQHAAQERIKYEFFKEKVGEVDPNERQTLLFPLTFHYSADEALVLRENMTHLIDIGVILEEFGTNSFVVREHPAWFPKDFEEEIIEELIEQVLRERKTDIRKLREDAAIMMSCKRSIKANHYLNTQQMEVLIQDLKKMVNPFTCPHGRPVIVHFKTYEIEKMFKRVM